MVFFSRPVSSIGAVSILIWMSLSFSCAGKQPVTDSLSGRQQHIARLTDTAHQSAKRGDKKTALAYHNKALQKSKEFNLPEHEARALLNIGMILKEENAGKGLGHLHAALAIAKHIRHKTLQSDIYLAMSDIYKQQQNYEEALHALEEHHRLLDNLLAENKNQEIERIRSDDAANFERKLWLMAVSIIILVTLIIGFYFRKTRKLNKALQQSNLIKDKLFSILGHDLKGPAGNVVQLLKEVESGSVSMDELQELITPLRVQSEALYEILESLLEWAHSQLKGTEVHPRTFDAKAIVRKNIEMLSGQAGNKQIRIEDATPGELSLFADEHHFDITIRNLLSNAVKFSHIGGTIQISSEEKKGEIIFSVRDEGVGISPARQKQLNTAGLDVSFGTNGEKGTGLGLLLIKEFIHADGGRIWLTSEQGKGTTFYFSIIKRSAAGH